MVGAATDSLPLKTMRALNHAVAGNAGVTLQFAFLSLLVIMPFAGPRTIQAEDYTGFAALPEVERDRIVWNLHEHHQWGLPEQEPICRDLLETQGHSFSNQIAWTLEAIDLAERERWKDLTPLFGRIYERPKNVWVYERAFRHLRGQMGRPISTNIVAAAGRVEAAGAFRSSVTEEQLTAAKRSLSEEGDTEAVLVYAIKVAG